MDVATEQSMQLDDGTASPGWAGRGAVVLAAGLTVGPLAVAVVMGLASDGVYHDDDACHYLFARDAWSNTLALLHQWGRPGYNLPTAVAARLFAMPGCRIFSAVQTATVAWLAFLIARRLARTGGQRHAWWPALAPGLVWAQPLVLTLAMTTLTETPAALYLALGLWLYVRGNRVWACAAFSALFVTRYETMSLAPILALAVILDAVRANEGKVGKVLKCWWLWASAAACLWAPVAYGLAAHATGLRGAASPLQMFSRSYATEYGSGPAYHFLSIWPQAAGVAVLACAAGGAIALGRRAWLATALTLGLVGAHSLLYWRGSFATGGYARFLVPLAGPLGVLGAAGLGAAWNARERVAVAAVPAAAAGLLALVIACWWHFMWPVLVRAWPDLPEAYRRDPLLSALTAAAPLAGVALLVLASPGWWRRGLGRLIGVAAAMLIVAQPIVLVRPLSLAASPLHAAIAEALEATDVEPYRGRAALTQHVMIRFLRENTVAQLGNAEALAGWRRAEVGTLFYWDGKYCYKRDDKDSTMLLWSELWRLGRHVYVGKHRYVVVFERSDRPWRERVRLASSQPVGPSR